jgi:hypothetical protein
MAEDERRNLDLEFLTRTANFAAAIKYLAKAFFSLSALGLPVLADGLMPETLKGTTQRLR